MKEPTSTAKFMPGIRLTLKRQAILDSIQAYVRTNGLRVSDSAVFRALISQASSDYGLVEAVENERFEITGSLEKEATRSTSISLNSNDRKKLESLSKELEILSNGKLTNISYNEILMALLAVAIPSEELQGLIRVGFDTKRSVRGRSNA